ETASSAARTRSSVSVLATCIGNIAWASPKITAAASKHPKPTNAVATPISSVSMVGPCGRCSPTPATYSRSAVCQSPRRDEIPAWFGTAAAATKRSPQDLVVLGQCGRHPVRILLPQPGLTLDVREQESHGP